jgi:hypothetical protein
MAHTAAVVSISAAIAVLVILLVIGGLAAAGVFRRKIPHQPSPIPHHPSPIPHHPSPIPRPTPAPPPAGGGTYPPAEIVGYWAFAWRTSAPPPAGLTPNTAVAFPGFNDPAKGLPLANAVKSSLVGSKHWITAGGGTGNDGSSINGQWSSAWVSAWIAAVDGGHLDNWDGLILDIEYCKPGEGATTLLPGWQSLLAKAKRRGLTTAMTPSHSAITGPGQWGNNCGAGANAAMTALLQDSNLDVLSPQMYGSDTGPHIWNIPEWSTDIFHYSQYKGMKPKLVPSLTMNFATTSAGGYQKTINFFKKLGVPVAGYIVWPESY